MRNIHYRATNVARILVGTLLLTITSTSNVIGNHQVFHSASPQPLQPHNDDSSQQSALSAPPPTGRTTTKISSSQSLSPAPPLTQKLVTPRPTTKKAWKFLLNGQFQAAAAAYRQAIKDNPQSAHAYVGLGISLKNLGKMEIAKKAFLKAVALEPQLPSALVHLGYLYAQGHFGPASAKNARNLFRRASQLGDPFADIALLDLQSGSKL